MKHVPLIASFFLFMALCASATYWALQFVKPPQRPMVGVVQPTQGDASLDAAAGLFGGRAAKVALASNFQLKGVVVAGNARESVAILVADGKPPLATRVDSEVIPGVIVKEVHNQYVLLSEGGIVKRVELQEGAKTSMQQVNLSAVSPPLMMQPVPDRTQAQVAPAMPATLVTPTDQQALPVMPPPLDEPPSETLPNVPPGTQPGQNGG
ncbi:MAG: general secretion pathway protein C [Burkholderiaceae bacterium]|jgi:general secretion pathway protein C